MTHTLPYLANCSMLFTELPLLERPAAARAAGFEAIEFWWPFELAVPPDREVDDFIAAISDSGAQLVGLNFFAGNLAGADAGLASIPGRTEEFRDGVEVAVGIAGALHGSVFNALYGVRVEDTYASAQDELATENLAWAANIAARIGATILIEPLSGPKPYPLRTAADVVGVVRRVRAAGAANVGWLCDLYHLATNGDDLDAAIASYHGDIAHVQIADVPGRGEPGSGSIDFDRHLTALQEAGYDGWVGLEYNPTTTTDDSLRWLPRERRGRTGKAGRS